MSERFEKFVKDHRDEFDVYEPSPEVWSNIAHQLKTPLQKSKTIWYYPLRIAAVLAIAFVSVFVYEKFIRNTTDNQSLAESEKSMEAEKNEILEAEVYYNHQVNLMLDELNRNYPEFQSVKADVKADLEELDQACKELKAELGNNINNEEIIVKLIENYRLKLNILEEVLFQLRKARESENKSSDNKNISL
ncbi:MAG TPA: hypothetical protein P5050_05985 [Bacteroidia bacterium]|nr:hypothetical protein [Bacteroidia bacterium]HRS58755.1 hypothetical protein [Bacteroidia bacterium]HRU67911.1 hypothetical protein [Bacteroidia bacterium]